MLLVLLLDKKQMFQPPAAALFCPVLLSRRAGSFRPARIFTGCESLDHVIHQGTVIRQRLYRSEEIIVRSVATDLFGETTSICTSSYAVSNKSGAAPIDGSIYI